MFGSGTAAVISPVGLIEHNGKQINIGDGTIGQFAQRLFDEITGIQYGKIEDRYGWIHSVKVCRMHFTFWNILAIGSGGFIGAIARYLLSTAVQHAVKPEQFQQF